MEPPFDVIVVLLCITALSFLGAAFTMTWRIVKKDEYSFLTNEVLFVSALVFLASILAIGVIGVSYGGLL